MLNWVTRFLASFRDDPGFFSNAVDRRRWPA
jgi:hypothetical protein